MEKSKKENFPQNISHNCGVKCLGDTCPICLFNSETRYYWDGLSGRILTIIDACISDKAQNKAMKDLIKQELWKNRLELEKIFFFYPLSLVKENERSQVLAEKIGYLISLNKSLDKKS